MITSWLIPDHILKEAQPLLFGMIQYHRKEVYFCNTCRTDFLCFKDGDMDLTKHLCGYHAEKHDALYETLLSIIYPRDFVCPFID